nr:hypothetical protein [Tanacetum cinerariifolium]
LDRYNGLYLDYVKPDITSVLAGQYIDFAVIARQYMWPWRVNQLVFMKVVFGYDDYCNLRVMKWAIEVPTVLGWAMNGWHSICYAGLISDHD